MDDVPSIDVMQPSTAMRESVRESEWCGRLEQPADVSVVYRIPHPTDPARGSGIDRPRRGRTGQALVEFALLVPILLLFFATVLDLGRVFYTYEAIANAAREGARYCALFKDANGATSRAQSELPSGISISVTFSPSCNTNLVGGTPVEAQVTTTFTPITPVISAVMGSQATLTATATMMVWE